MKHAAPTGSPGEIVVRVAGDDRDRAGAVEVRRAVFVREQQVPEELEMDALDDLAIHLVAVEADRVVGTARLYEEPGVWHVGRVAVLPEWRRRGIGKRLMLLAASVARERQGRGLVLNAQVAVVPFYEHLGFSPEGDPFLEAGILHRTMRRSLLGEPAGQAILSD